MNTKFSLILHFRRRHLALGPPRCTVRTNGGEGDADRPRRHKVVGDQGDRGHHARPRRRMAVPYIPRRSRRSTSPT
jgi:hypothetical protein